MIVMINQLLLSWQRDKMYWNQSWNKITDNNSEIPSATTGLSYHPAGWIVRSQYRGLLYIEEEKKLSTFFISMILCNTFKGLPSEGGFGALKIVFYHLTIFAFNTLITKQGRPFAMMWNMIECYLVARKCHEPPLNVLINIYFKNVFLLSRRSG